jgi:hypothetical protein
MLGPVRPKINVDYRQPASEAHAVAGNIVIDGRRSGVSVVTDFWPIISQVLIS